MPSMPSFFHLLLASFDELFILVGLPLRSSIVTLPDVPCTPGSSHSHTPPSFPLFSKMICWISAFFSISLIIIDWTIYTLKIRAISRLPIRHYRFISPPLFYHTSIISPFSPRSLTKLIYFQLLRHYHTLRHGFICYCYDGFSSSLLIISSWYINLLDIWQYDIFASLQWV